MTATMTRIQLGLIVAPALDAEPAASFRDELGRVLSERYPSVEWDLRLVRDPLVRPPVHLTELVEVTRQRMLAEGWDLALLVTDVPFRLARRPLLSHASPTHGVALVLLPAVGVVARLRRLRDAAADAVGMLIGDPPRDREGRRGPHVQRRLRELATDVDAPDDDGVAFLARVISGNVRLLLGMIGANHPWRLVGRLSRALLGALAVAVFALVTSDVWRIATSLDPPRLAVLTLASVAAAVVTLIAVHRLWERAPERHAREQVVLFNLATLATVAFGIAALYAAVFVASLAVAGLLIDSSVFAGQLGHDVDVSDYLRLAWLTSSLATVGGALGAMLETDDAVREAAYAYRPDPDVTTSSEPSE
ncbi:MAG TPA: hypothetical protein VFD90_10280 [Gaiellales bacterium]|nr:hypothetical protein [Gaiellales bacterium]